MFPYKVIKNYFQIKPSTLTLSPFMVKKTEMLGPVTLVILRSEGESGLEIHIFIHLTNIY